MTDINSNSEMPRQNIEFVISEKEVEIIPDKYPIKVIDVNWDIGHLEAKQLKNKSNTDILYHLRVTHYNCEISGQYVHMESQQDLKPWLSQFGCIAPYSDKYVAGLEHFKKGMNPTKSHCHIYFLSKMDKETIRKGILRWYEETEKDNKLSGNKKYALSVVPNINEKAFRYALKQQKNETYRGAFISSTMVDYIMKECEKTPEQLRDEAYAVWITACEVADAKEKKMDESKQFGDRLFSFLDKKGNTTDLMLKVDIQTFYIEVENKPFNHQTARGYLINYKVTRKLMNHFELAEQWGN